MCIFTLHSAIENYPENPESLVVQPHSRWKREYYHHFIIIITLLKAINSVMVIYYFSQPMLGILSAIYWELKQNDQNSSHLQETFGKESGKKKDWEGELSACHSG